MRAPGRLGTVLGNVLGTVIGIVIGGILLAGPARAGDFHVTVGGSDATGDGSAARPWRTLTHALTQLPPPETAGALTLRVGPGLWHAASGEVLPLLVPEGVTVTGAGASQTILAGSAPDGRTPPAAPTAVLVRIQPGPSGWTGSIGPTGVENLSLHHARIGIEVLGTSSAVPDPRLRNLVFWQNQVAVQVVQAAATIEQCDFDTATMGLAVTRPSPAGPELRVFACRFRFNVHGINASNAMRLRVERNRFEQNGTGVLIGTIGSNAVMQPIFCNNVYLLNGYGFTATALASSQTLPTLAHETFAFNQIGIASVDNAGSGSRSDPVIRNCIIWGSAVADVTGVERDEIRNSALRIASGTSAPPQIGQNGITGADPLFVDPGRGDLHLSAASPMIDQGRADYAGAPDHDLDGEPRATGYPDLGADEFQGFLRRDAAASTPGQLVLRLTARADAGLVYVVAASHRAGGSGGIPLGERHFPLHPGPLFFATVGLTNGIPGFLGTLDAQGRATVVVPVPWLPQPRSQIVHFGFVTLDPTAHHGIRTISNPAPVELAMP